MMRVTSTSSLSLPGLSRQSILAFGNGSLTKDLDLRNFIMDARVKPGHDRK